MAENANARSESADVFHVDQPTWKPRRGAGPRAFEGSEVTAVRNVVRGSLELDSDEELHVDDRIAAKVYMRVVGVRHEVDGRGELVRTQILKPVLSYVETEQHD